MRNFAPVSPDVVPACIKAWSSDPEPDSLEPNSLNAVFPDPPTGVPIRIAEFSPWMCSLSVPMVLEPYTESVLIPTRPSLSMVK